MRKLLVVIVLAIGTFSYGQENKTEEKEKPLVEFESESVTIDPDLKLNTYSGNVNLKTDLLTIKNAKRIIYDEITKQIIATGYIEFSIDGEIRFSGKGKMKRLRYTLGESVAYIE
ncbi:hypothetical protein AAU57_00320 [Nonlabens sp. YIK11]|uniref:hypothetical protein n=1 Tax=Nonlabens sp. YIK11 TaxID=1453349 RepID=UPI0006DCAB83|nr:hypothetical protein [Nonlabens sp. YIK11]KQC31935.1 hypothetical protein AAU57_00320 [Nonlabens sp. YIK11]